MANDYYTDSNNPSAGSQMDSSVLRAEFDSILAAFDKLAPLTGNGNKTVVINPGGTGMTAKTAAEMQTLLALVPGTNVQVFDATLLSLAALGTAADKLAYTTALDTWAETAFTAVARTLIAQTTQALMRTTGLGAGTTGSDLFTAATAAAARTTLVAPSMTLVASGTLAVSDNTIGNVVLGSSGNDGYFIFSVYETGGTREVRYGSDMLNTNILVAYITRGLFPSSSTKLSLGNIATGSSYTFNYKVYALTPP